MLLNAREDDIMTHGPTMHTAPRGSQFPTTRWTLVVAAGDPHKKEARSALVALCENYWYPLYAYLRRRGYSRSFAVRLYRASIWKWAVKFIHRAYT